MKKSSLLAVTLTPLLAASGLVYAQDPVSVATDPVGFVKVELEPGLNAVGLPMLLPAVAAGLVDSNDGSSITMASEVGTLPAGPHFLEVVNGPGDAVWVGERFEVSGSAGAVVSINTASSNNTFDLGSIDLSGYSVVVRPHLTASAAFPPADANEGDQILTFNPDTGGFNITTIEDDIFGGGLSWSSDIVLAPGTGMFYRNTGSDAISVTNLGDVRVTHFRQPLASGLNFVSQGHPVSVSAADRMMNEETGFEAGDQVLTFNPATGGFNVVTLEEDIFTGGLEWSSAAEVFTFNGAVFVRKATADESYEAPVTY